MLIDTYLSNMDVKFVFMCVLLKVIREIVCSDEAKVIYTNEGELVTLHCPLGNNFTTTWNGPPGIQLSIGEDINPNAKRRDRLHAFQTNQSNAYSLQIKNATKIEDEGIYFCEVSVSQKWFNLKFRIDVHNVSLSPSDNPLNIQEGRKKQVVCVVNANADPSPSITWFLGSTNITGIARTNTSSIIITGKRGDKEMILKCRAANNNKPPRTASTTLNIEYIPEVLSLTSSPYRVNEGNPATLQCKVTDGNPMTDIGWKWFYEKNSSYVLFTEKTYTIPKVRREKSGNYSCTATNSVGTSVAATIHLDIQYKPDVSSLTLSPYRVTEGQTATLKCNVTAANPNINITWRWFNTDNPTYFLYDGSTYIIPGIKRNRSGFYNCTASNYIGTSVPATISVDIQYKPDVSSLTSSPYRVLEGQTATLKCNMTAANPNINITWRWFNTDNPTYFLHDGSTYIIPGIQRNRSGLYNCTASNSIGTSVPAIISVDIQYKPEIVKNNQGTVVNEHEKVTLRRQIISNPLSNVSWYNGSDLLDTQWLVRNATFDIENATCTDTKNFTLVANNGVQGNVTAMVELIVNCKPRSYKTNVTLGVTDTTGIDFSTIVIAYPEPSIELEHENGTVSDQMMKIINRNAVNNFTIQISQAVVNQSDFGVYHLKLGNSYGNFNVIINVIPQRKPNVPVSIEIVCEETRAKVQWKSSFNGGDPQLFTVIASSGQQSNNISDRGENVFHSTFVQHLQPSTMYVFYVSAQNSHGIISSEKKSCTTLAESTDKLPIIAGSAAAGGLTLVVILVVVVFLFRRYTNTEKQAGKSQRFENDLVENESVDDDGLKDNILYVSADPKENEKHEAAVYAAVNKKNSMSNNNSNVYAEVKKNGKKGVKEGALYSDVKPKKGFFKKDGKVKKEKRQKRKQEVADVYENSDDIAMTANPDTVYSNTNQNNDSAKEERGYKNKDGLLYIEVKFDTKTEERNPVIHGDDEKTDYATVEFPVPSSSHDRE